MTGKITPELLERIRDRVDIQRLIGEYVPLKRAGRTFKGLCPFHKEKTPSFIVNPERQIFKCFGCGESGDIITFLMKYDGIPFMEAVERLARMAGVTLPNEDTVPNQKKSQKNQLMNLLRDAQNIFHSTLLSFDGKHAREYLERRGLDDRLIREYQLGFAPDEWTFLLPRLMKKNATPHQLESAGLVVKNRDGDGYHDRFRNRIIFPIREHREGHVVGFGGRTLGDDPAKYLNTPETEVYKKSKILYGLWEALPAIRKSREVIIVEGYFDRISLDRVGVKNCVAPCGTALTSDQIRILKQTALKMILLFDADSAGINATHRALELTLGAGLESVAVPLPVGKDPDDVVKEVGLSGIQNLMTRGKHALDFLISVKQQQFSENTTHARRRIIEEMLPFLMAVDNSIDRGTYISRIAELIGVPDTSIVELLRRRSMKKNSPGNAIPSVRTNNEMPAERLDPRERDFFIFLLLNPKILAQAYHLVATHMMITNQGKMLYQILIDHFSQGEPIKGSSLLDLIPNQNLKEEVSTLMMDSSAGQRLISSSPEMILEALHSDFFRFHLKAQLGRLSEEIRRTESDGRDITPLLTQKMDILRQLKSLGESRTKLTLE